MNRLDAPVFDMRHERVVHAAEVFKGELPKEVAAAFRKTNLAVSIGLALVCHASIVVVATATVALFSVNWPLAVAAYPIAAAVIARQQRGLELLVHDASHRSWSRKHPRVNDAAANVLVAWPTFSHVADYWKFHREHHAAFGMATDPCKRRFAQMKEALRPGHRLSTMVTYTVNWYRETAGKPLAMGRALLWHIIALGLPLTLTIGWLNAVVVWLAFWAAPQFLFLPWLRFVAELEEHDYEGERAEAQSTFSNVGWFHEWVVHPLKDGYHMVHHAFPAIPQWRHKSVHEYLMARSALYRNGLARTAPLGKAGTLEDLS